MQYEGGRGVAAWRSNPGPLLLSLAALAHERRSQSAYSSN
jgi:hypothetical protein